MGIEELRRSYEDATLDADSLASDPLTQFTRWFEAAQASDSPQWFEANAMTLASAGQSGRVSARIVLLKKFSEAGFVFFTNYDSDKGQQLAENPQASLVFYWPHLEQQIRIEGTVTKTDAATSSEYFHARPRGSQIGAIVSQQSRPLATRQELEAEAERLSAVYANQEIPCPDYWGGYCLEPSRYEFWQGRPSRLHDRFIYERSADQANWTTTRLAP